MKWVYLPFMLALAFLYTKISYNNFQIEGGHDSRLITRRPASLTDSKNKVNPYYRVPSSIFYKNLSSEDFLLFNKVVPYRGTIVGEVHVESFGYVIDDRKKVNFTINDFSEVTEGALFHDVLGHLVSAKSLDKRISWINYFEAYKKGLRGENFSLSFYNDKGVGDAFLNSEKLVSENISTDYPFEFTRLKKTHHHVDVVKKSSIQNEMTKLFPKAQFFDLVQSNNDSDIYQILIRLRPQDKIEWMELRESTHTDYDKSINKDKGLEFSKRFQLSKINIYSGNMDKSLFMLHIDNKFFIAKFAEQFISKIKLDEIPFDDYHDIVLDEAYVLGKIHAKSLGEDTDDYIKSWATIPAVSIDEHAIGMKFRLRDSVKIMNKEEL